MSDSILTLVVCTLGRTDQLRRLLVSLEAQTDKRFRTIIVDQNPAGFLDAVLRDAGNSPLVLRAKPGLSRARNLGIAHAGTPLIGFPDDDCWYGPATVAEVIGRFGRAPAMQVLTGRTVDADGHESVNRHLLESCRIDRSSVFLAGNSSTTFARREAILDAGGFDESLGVGAGTMFGSGEETDFLLRCLRHGFEIGYERDFLVHHEQVAISGADLGRIRRYSAGFGRVARLHRLGAAFVGARVARAAARSCLFLVTGDIGQARSRWTWIRGCLAGFTASSP